MLLNRLALGGLLSAAAPKPPDDWSRRKPDGSRISDHMEPRTKALEPAGPRPFETYRGYRREAARLKYREHRA